MKKAVKKTAIILIAAVLVAAALFAAYFFLVKPMFEREKLSEGMTVGEAEDIEAFIKDNDEVDADEDSGLIYMNHSDNYPLATYISTIVDSAKDLNLITDPEEIERIMKVSERNMSSAKIFVSMIPILIIYPFLQRYFVKGIVLGSVKG